MYVRKRDGRTEPVMFDKITWRLRKLCYNLNTTFVDPVKITMKVINGIYSGIKTVELDNLAAETAATMVTKHPDYACLAARIVVSNLHKETAENKSFSDTIELLYNYVIPETGERAKVVSNELYKFVMEHKERLNSTMIYDRDFQYSYFGFKTLERAYLFKINGVTKERPQHLLMRVAASIHLDDIDATVRTYDLLSQMVYTHATPTMYNAGSCQPQLASCFLLSMKSDSISGIFDTAKECAIISKYAGGIGLHCHNIRAAGSFIAGTNGYSNGLVPLLRVFNNIARYVDQGGNKRPGSFAIYIEPWHADIFSVLELRKNVGSEELRARDLFYALWIPDLFMRRVEADEDWYLMCPNQSPGLFNVYGSEFDDLYMRYEAEGRYVRRVKAQKLWFAIVEAQIETGMPYMLYKDACNIKSNQKNLGTIKSSNLCCEIIEYSSPDEIAVCNLASICLPKFVEYSSPDQGPSYNFQHLHDVVKTVTATMDKVIQVSYYPLEYAKNSNLKHRPIGIGVQGLADTFMMMRYPFDSEEARKLNILIFETIYHAAIESSCELAEKYGPYESYHGSPASMGMLQYDLWNVTPTTLWDWDALKEKVARHGLRNSLTTTCMPTASTSQIMGNNECIEPYTSNIYTRRVISGEFQVVNRHLMLDLVKLKLWDEDMRNRILANNGSVQDIQEIPKHIRDLYKTSWELSMKTLIDLSADRAPFIDQSQSFNLFVSDPKLSNITSMHFYAWRKGLKTGMYYLRTRPAANAIQFTVDQESIENNKRKKQACSEDAEFCTRCSA